MAQLTIVGLGPGSLAQLTQEAWTVLTQAGEVWCRTLHHPVISELPTGPALHSFDFLYEKAETFEEVYAAIVVHVLELARREEGVIYAVPGHPLVGEAAVPRLLAAAREAGLPVRVVHGLSFIEPLLTALEVDALDGVQIADALDVTALHHPPFNPDLPLLLGQVYSRAVASDLKLVLMNQYPDEHRVALVRAAGTPQEQVLWLPLFEIDRHPADPLTSLYVPALPSVSGFEGFQETIAHLRAPEGCPWDRKQTHTSLRNNLLEEAYEVLAALDAEDVDALREELGDLLLQIVLHAQIATEGGEFQMTDVVSGIDAKIKHRHPHVWGGLKVSDSEEVSTNWEAIKREERVANGQAERSLLDGVPKTLPALAQASAYASRVKRVGFDWPSIAGVVDKVQEEFAELQAAESAAERSAEVGDVLFAVANWARWLEIDPETALREANARFARRFHYIEMTALQRGVALQTLGPEEMDRLWEEAKAKEDPKGR